MGTRRSSSRIMFYVVSIITLILLLGSTALQRIVFKADQVSSAVFMTPGVINLKPGSVTAVRLQASFAGTATVAAAQFSLTFDSSMVEVVGTKTGGDWMTAKVDIQEGNLRWAVLPATTKGTVLEASGEIVFGEVSIKALKEGKALLDLSSTQTRIVAVDPGQTPSVYNSVSTTQTSTLTVSDTATPPQPLVPMQETESKELAGDLQKFQSVSEVIGDSAAELIVTTDRPSMVSVLFGPNPQTLLNSVVSTNFQTSSALRLSDLEPNTRYYYRFRAENGNRDINLSRVRSFQTSLVRAGESIKRVNIAASQTPAPKNTVIYFVATSAEGAIVTDIKPIVAVEKGVATVGEPALSGGIYQVAVSSKLSTKQNVSLSISANNQKIGQVAVAFDPNIFAQAAPSVATNSALPLTQTNLLVLMVLAGLLLILGLLFYRLAKVK